MVAISEGLNVMTETYLLWLWSIIIIIIIFYNYNGREIDIPWSIN